MHRIGNDGKVAPVLTGAELNTIIQTNPHQKADTNAEKTNHSEKANQEKGLRGRLVRALSSSRSRSSSEGSVNGNPNLPPPLNGPGAAAPPLSPTLEEKARSSEDDNGLTLSDVAHFIANDSETVQKERISAQGTLFLEQYRDLKAKQGEEEQGEAEQGEETKWDYYSRTSHSQESGSSLPEENFHLGETIRNLIFTSDQTNNVKALLSFDKEPLSETLKNLVFLVTSVALGIFSSPSFFVFSALLLVVISISLYKISYYKPLSEIGKELSNLRTELANTPGGNSIKPVDTALYNLFKEKVEETIENLGDKCDIKFISTAETVLNGLLREGAFLDLSKV